MNLTLHFGGFYQGIHKEIITSIVDSKILHLSNDSDYFDVDGFYASLDYPKIYLEYGKYYVKQFFLSVLSDYNIKLTIRPKNISINSPKDYNSYTDVIILSDVSKTTIKNLTRLFKQLVKDDKKSREFIDHKTISRDALYIYDKVIAKVELDVSLNLILLYLTDEFNNNLDIDNFMENIQLYYLLDMPF